MARYIDADRLINEISGNGGVFVYGPQAVSAIVSRINVQPTADVAEVKHGHWITDENGIVICSECGEEHAWDEYRATYCEDCGTKMDGGS